MLKEVLTAALKNEHREAGLYLEEDEDMVYLKHDEKVLAKWFAHSEETTIALIRAEANKLSCLQFLKFGVYACDSCHKTDCWSGL